MDALDNNKMVNEIAMLASKHKIVPFLGAGTSIKHLNLDWDALTSELANEIGIVSNNNLEVAEKYEQKMGKSGLCDFLKKRIVVEKYDENKDIAPLIVLSLRIGVVYTTNQDNVFELCAKQYGRIFKKIITLSDIGASYPGDYLYVKYHGDLDEPDSLIFTRRSYDERINNVDHFLNIRMRSDLLVKNFLFIGYSFRDPNIIKLLEELSAAFRGSLPSSYFIAFSYTSELENLNKKYGIKIIDPVRELDGQYAAEKAFDLFLSAICKKTWYLKESNEIAELFKPSIPRSRLVVTKYEIEAIEEKIKNSPIKDSMCYFRNTFDGALIPEIYHERVVDLFLKLAKQCVTRELSDELNGAAFNLILKTEYAIEVLSAVIATAQFRGVNKNRLDIFLPHVKNVSDDLRPFCTARAIEYLREWNIKIDDTFRQHVTYWMEGYQKLPKEAIEYIKSQMDYAWSEKTTFEHPFSYWKRVGLRSCIGKGRTFDDIRKDLERHLPKKFGKPYEE